MALFRRGTQPILSIEPDPLRTADDAYETGLLIGLTGSAGRGVAAKNVKDRLVAWANLQEQPAVHAAGKAAGKRAGSPPAR